jgi:hypothetical protein
MLPSIRIENVKAEQLRRKRKGDFIESCGDNMPDFVSGKNQNQEKQQAELKRNPYSKRGDLLKN